MVLINDGSSEYDGHAWSEQGNLSMAFVYIERSFKFKIIF